MNEKELTQHMPVLEAAGGAVGISLALILNFHEQQGTLPTVEQLEGTLDSLAYDSQLFKPATRAIILAMLEAISVFHNTDPGEGDGLI